MNQTQEYDAIVIGAGHNGLAAAVQLSSQGWRVLVLERARVAGGAVKTAELTLPGFRHDLYAMNLSMFAGSAFFARHKAQLLAAGLGFVPAKRTFASVFDDGRWLGVDTDLSRTLERLRAHCPPHSVRDAERWEAMVKKFGDDAPHLFAMLGAPMPSWKALGALWNMLRKKGLSWTAQTALLLLSSSRNWLDRHFDDPDLKAMMAAWGMHLDFAPDIAGGALFPYLESMLNQHYGMVIGAGGADSMIRAMVKVIEQCGGAVHTGCEVGRIEVANGKACGVQLVHGGFIRARRAVIANVHPRALYDRLLANACADHAPAARAAQLRPGPGTMMIHLALDALPQWRGGTELQQYAYVHIAPSMDAMATTYCQAMAGQLPSEPALVVGQPTAIDPSRAPEGKHVLWIQVRVVPAEIRGDAAGLIGDRDWDSVKEQYAERVLDIIERHAPGLRSQILARHVLSPLDLERDNPNLVGGDSLAGSHHTDQFFCFRPAFGLSRWRTPVAQLYMVGASTWPGAGTGAGSGYMLACELGGTR